MLGSAVKLNLYNNYDLHFFFLGTRICNINNSYINTTEQGFILDTWTHFALEVIVILQYVSELPATQRKG